MALPRKHFKALLFDCYGTLIVSLAPVPREMALDLYPNQTLTRQNWEAGMNAHTNLVLSPTGQTGPKRDDFFVILGDLEHQLQAEHPTMLYPKV